MRQIQIHEKILIAGASGMVGSAINRALLKKGYGKENEGELLIPTREELDLLDNNAVKKWFRFHNT